MFYCVMLDLYLLEENSSLGEVPQLPIEVTCNNSNAIESYPNRKYIRQNNTPLFSDFN